MQITTPAWLSVINKLNGGGLATPTGVNMRKPIALYTLNNVSGILIYEVTDEYVVAGLNEYKPEKFEVKYDGDRPYFDWGGMIYLDECIKIVTN